jgi:hypothetical protein
MNDPNERYDYISKMTPKELETCVMTPNMDAFTWKPPNLNVLSRTRTLCENTADATKHVLNNGIVFETQQDVSVSTPNMQFDIFNDVDGDVTRRLVYPELLYRSRLRGINLHEEDVFYLHKRGKCSTYCKTFQTFNTSNMAREWCDTNLECDGFTRNSDGTYYTWSFTGGSYEYTATSQVESFIKSSSVEDDCHHFTSIEMFKPKQLASSR